MRHAFAKAAEIETKREEGALPHREFDQECAKDAAPYSHPRLTASTVDLNVRTGLDERLAAARRQA